MLEPWASARTTAADPVLGRIAGPGGASMLLLPVHALNQLAEGFGQAASASLYASGKQLGAHLAPVWAREWSSKRGRPLDQAEVRTFNAFIQTIWSSHGLGRLWLDWRSLEQGIAAVLLKDASGMGAEREALAWQTRWRLGFLCGLLGHFSGQALDAYLAELWTDGHGQMRASGLLSAPPRIAQLPGDFELGFEAALARLAGVATPKVDGEAQA
jgi:hypothetical protein